MSLLAYSALAVVWPLFAFLSFLIFDAPGSDKGIRSIPNYLFAGTIVFYGPIYLYALIATRVQKWNKHEMDMLRTWTLLCGGDIALMFFSQILVLLFHYF